MTTNSIRITSSVGALLLLMVAAARADAQCCPQPVTAFQPTAVTAFQPVVPVAPVAHTGWYPGFWLDRIRARLWGAPTTFVAAHPQTFVAAHPRVAAFAPTYTTAFRPVHTVAYAAPVATTVAAPVVAPACPACPAPTLAAFAPASAPVCPACPACPAPVAAAYPAPAVGQVVQAQAAPCPSCAPVAVAAPAPAAAVAVPAPAAVAVPGPAAVPGPPPGAAQAPRTYDQQTPAPSLPPGFQMPDQPQDAQRVPPNGLEPQPEPAEEDYNGTNATYFQAPKLLDPNDRTAHRSPAPVISALYEKSVTYYPASYQPITQQQAEQDAIGWVSISR